jgi:hypothetical protein
VFASIGFVVVTGYSRKDIVPRNCRFLQGEMTDFKATHHLRAAIDVEEDTVELLLNYRNLASHSGICSIAHHCSMNEARYLSFLGDKLIAAQLSILAQIF